MLLPPDDGDLRSGFGHPERHIRGDCLRLVKLFGSGRAAHAAHLASASKVLLTIELERLPVHPGVSGAGDRAPALVAAEGGEDYELLVALPERFGESEAAGCLAETGIPLTRVGHVAVGEGVRLLHHGEPVALRGYDHFR